MLTKSQYVDYYKCPKFLWLKYNKLVGTEQTLDSQRHIDDGLLVGRLARGLFGEYNLVNEKRPDGHINPIAMVNTTKHLIKASASVICEASFLYNDCYCAVDILRRVPDGWEIYEVKAVAGKYDKKGKYKFDDNHVADLAFQKWVVEHCGLKVIGTYLVHLNSSYIRQGELDIQKLFTIENADEKVSEHFEAVEDGIFAAREILTTKEEPEQCLNCSCKKDSRLCEGWKHCAKNLPKPSVFDIYYYGIGNAVEQYKNGVVTLTDVYNKQIITGKGVRAKIQRLQIESYVKNSPMYVDKLAVKQFLGQMRYPLYFLDFETIQICVPQFDGTSPYQQIPFQYSLHTVFEDGHIEHREFLGESGTNTMRPLAEKLARDISCSGSVVVYNKSFEDSRLREMANALPDLSEKLNGIRENIVDLMDVFTSGSVYKKEMGGSLSIKSVLPAFFPNDSDLDYHALEDVHNGTEAMSIFPLIKDMPLEQQQIARSNLLKYCCLDTLAMVKIWQKLQELAI